MTVVAHAGGAVSKGLAWVLARYTIVGVECLYVPIRIAERLTNILDHRSSVSEDVNGIVEDAQDAGSAEGKIRNNVSKK